MDWQIVNSIATVALYVLILGVWKPWTRAYADEKGKNFARKEDLNEILAEVRAQKEIEAKLTGEQWDRQMRWNQKRDLYVDLLTFTQDLGQAFGEIPATLKMRADPRPNYSAEGAKNFSNCLTRINENQVKFAKTLILSHIFTMPECFTTLTEFVKSRTHVDPPTAEWAALEAAKFNTLVGTLAKIAKKDLGLE